MNSYFKYLISGNKSATLLVILVFSLCSCNRFNQSYNEIPPLPPSGTDFNKQHLEVLNKLISDDDENDELFWQRSILYLKIGMQKEALNDIKRAVDLNNEKYHYYKTLAQAYVLNSKYDSAIYSATYSRNSGNDDYQLNLILAEAYLYKGQVKQSLEEIEYAIKIDPENYYSYYLRGLAYKARKDTIKYKEDILKSLEYRPNDKKVYKELVDYHLSTNNVNAAKNILDQMISTFSEDVEMVGQKAELFEKENKLDSAYYYYGIGLGKDSSLYKLTLKMGNIKFKLRDYSLAARHYMDVLKYDRNNFEAQYKLGLSFENSHNFSDAILALERASILDSANNVISTDINRITTKIFNRQKAQRQRREEEPRRIEPLPELPSINQ